MGDRYNDVNRKIRKLKRIARVMKDTPDKEQDRKKIRRSIRKIKEGFGIE